MHLHLIYTETEMLLSKKPYTSWREIQDEYPGYKASLGPWTVQQVLEFIVDEYPDLSPPASVQIDQALASGSISIAFTFNRPR